MDFIDSKIEDYAGEHTTPESELLYKVNRETHLKVLNPRMLSGHLQGQMLRMISLMIQPKYVLEVGTYTGYSALCMLEGLRPDGEIHTIDIDEELAVRSQSYFDQAPKGSQIKAHLGDAVELIQELKKPWDLVFLDADKANYCHYYDHVIEDLQPGGYLLADNVLWSGKVVEEVKPDDLDTQGLINFNKKIQEDQRVDNLLLPIRDGLMLVRKKNDLD